jgi:hypothetical protein
MSNNTEQNKTAEREKMIAVDFFYWWHNQPGNNTEAGFNEYRKTERYKMLDVSITIEADIRDEQASARTKELEEENKRLKDLINTLEELVVATDKYIDSISGRNIVWDMSAANNVDSISKTLEEKYKALKALPPSTNEKKV